MTQCTTSENPRAAEKLRGVCVGLREDLEVSRHTFRGQPAYVVRDPITFQSQKLDPGDYAVFCRITSEQSLGATFDALVEEQRLTLEDEDRFYEFIIALHTLGFLRLPLSDDRMLFKRHMLREQIRRREKLSNILFLRIPVWNPNAFLDRTIGVMRPMFSRWAFGAWALLLTAATYVAFRNWQELIDPIAGLLVADNLPLLWLTLIGLKVFHEFGHAYACKHYGGHVPEMGIFLILFTPCAYVDATASWGFPKKRHRLFVSLAGMYVEMALAAVAVIVWAVTTPSLVNAIAHNVIFLASAVTVLFNVNPLLRYDGYYILCDLLEVPNLRARSSQCLLDQMKRVLLGIAAPSEPGGRRLTGILCGFGIAAALYRMTLMVAITAILASKMFVVGLLVGGILIGRTLVSLALKMTRYLWYAEETVSRRVRAVALSLIVLLLAPAGMMWIPIQSSVQAAGVTRRAQEVVVRAAAPGFVARVPVEPGETPDRDLPLVELENEQVAEQLLDAQAKLRASHIRADAYRLDRPDKLSEERAAFASLRAIREQADERARLLTVTAPITGQVVQCLSDSDLGRFLQEGDPVATIGSGGWHVRTVLTAEQLASCAPRVGMPITFRPAHDPARAMEGRVVQVVPAGSHTVSVEALTHLGGRAIAVDPTTHRAREPYFEVTAALTGVPPDAMHTGLTGELRLKGKREPIGVALLRRVVRFWNNLRRD